jgi:hypothetical protein
VNEEVAARGESRQAKRLALDVLEPQQVPVVVVGRAYVPQPADALDDGRRGAFTLDQLVGGHGGVSGPLAPRGDDQRTVADVPHRRGEPEPELPIGHREEPGEHSLSRR